MTDKTNIRFHRDMTRPFFVRERITDFDIFDSHASNVLEQVADRLNTGYPVDFQVRTYYSYRPFC